MKKTISLGGTWRMHWRDVGTGQLGAAPESPVLDYTVPGDVHTPLIDAGLIPEPLEGLNSLDCRWVEEKEFWCERTFRLSAAELAPVMLLTFDGKHQTFAKGGQLDSAVADAKEKKQKYKGGSLPPVQSGPIPGQFEILPEDPDNPF